MGWGVISASRIALPGDFSLAWWSALDVRHLPDGRVQTLNTIVFHFGDGPTVIVPKWRVCDLASTPEYWPLPNKVRSSAGAILHDELYAHAEEQEAELRRNDWPGFKLTRERADSLARTVWRCDRLMGRGWSAIYWAGVRVGGRAAWERHRSVGSRTRLS